MLRERRETLEKGAQRLLELETLNEAELRDLVGLPSPGGEKAGERPAAAR